MIEIKNISKKFKIYNHPKERLIEWLTLGNKIKHQEYQALKDINITVKQGEIFGIVGLNGAGKSTLLKIITGTMAPSTGSIYLKGKVSALLELGTGFHMDLTGRENVKMNGKLLGLNDEKIEKKLPVIEEFSELGDYFDKPIRTYSTGMQVRLAFSLATSVEPDILIVDEALSVGDAYFQQKCINKMKEFKRNGVTILFVSHDLPMLKIFCDRLALLQHGTIDSIGEPSKILDLYNAKLAEHNEGFKIHYNSNPSNEVDHSIQRSGNGKAVVEDVSILNHANQKVQAIEAGLECSIRIKIKFTSRIENPTVGILIQDRLGYDIFGTNTNLLCQKTGIFTQGETAHFHFDCKMNLGPGEYTLSIAVHQDSSHVGECFDWIDRIQSLTILPQNSFQFVGVSLLNTKFRLERLKQGDHELDLQ